MKSLTSTTILTPTLITEMNPPTDTVNVLSHLKELRDTWRRQDFTFSKSQQEEYDMLIAARRERVKYFVENGLVAKPGLRKKEEEVDD